VRSKEGVKKGAVAEFPHYARENYPFTGRSVKKGGGGGGIPTLPTPQRISSLTLLEGIIPLPVYFFTEYRACGGGALHDQQRNGPYLCHQGEDKPVL